MTFYSSFSQQATWSPTHAPDSSNIPNLIPIEWGKGHPHDVTMQAQRGGGDIATTNYKPRRRRRWEVSTMLWPLYHPGNEPVNVIQEAGWTSGPVWTGMKNLFFAGILTSVDTPNSTSKRAQLILKNKPENPKLIRHFISSSLLRLC